MSRRTQIIGGGVLVVLVILAVGLILFREPQAATEPAVAVPLDAPAGATVLVIDPAQSEARFTLDEELRGQPKTVVGTTNQVSGQIAFDLNNPAGAQLGTIQVNARTLATDSEFRNRAIKNEILQSDTYEFVTFTPTALSGLPASAAVGDTITFQVTGDLTVRDVTRPATFDVTVTLAAENQLTGSATTTIQRADYNLVIPNVPGVANVSEEVTLAIDFVASAP
ncbi:MAG: YceI family protein [Ardenticatenaceae bacterium]|nr:YceI family protein [Anaerolineales bacterium]MCB8919152.1 YceI family protein [Ardenticatenaceae bacterium]